MGLTGSARRNDGRSARISVQSIVAGSAAQRGGAFFETDDRCSSDGRGETVQNGYGGRNALSLGIRLTGR